MRTGIPLQQKIDFDEHEKRKKEKEKHEKYLDSGCFSGIPYTYGYFGIVYFHDARQVS